MKSDYWMVDVLADLKRFAAMNGMQLLASQLDRTASLAETEIESRLQVAGPSRMGDCDAGWPDRTRDAEYDA